MNEIETQEWKNNIEQWTNTAIEKQDSDFAYYILITNKCRKFLFELIDKQLYDDLQMLAMQTAVIDEHSPIIIYTLFANKLKTYGLWRNK